MHFPGLITILAVTAFLPSARAQFPAAHELPGDLSSAPAAGDQRHAAIARGNGQSLVVYEDHRAAIGETMGYTSSGVAVLNAARFDAAGALIDQSPIIVRKGTNSPRDPRVAWNGSTYLVVWDELVRHQSASDRGVFAARVDTAGHVLDDPAILLTDVSYVDESYPVVSSDGTSFAVAWVSIVNNADAIQGCVIDPNGIAGPLTTMMTAQFGSYFPRAFEMAWSGGQYLFVSMHGSSGVSFNQIHAQRFDASLHAVGTEFRLSSGPGAAADPWVTGNGTDFCVAWRQANLAIRATPVTAAGTVVVPDGVDVMGPTPGYGAYQLPTVGWDGANWNIVFGTGSIQSWAMNVSVLSPSGVLSGSSPVAISQGNAEMSHPACARVSGGVQILWDDARNNPAPVAAWGADNLDVFSAILSPGGTVSTPVDISQSPPAQIDPQIAGDATQGYLVAYFSVTQSAQTVNVQRLDPAGHPIDPQPIPVFTGPRTLHNLAAAWSGSNWMIVWEEFTYAGSTVNGVRIATNGTVLDASPIALMPGSGAAIAAVNGDYLVVATNEPVLHHRYVYTMRVRAADGVLLDAAPVQRTNVGYDVSAAVAAFNNQWIVAWSHGVTHDAPYASIRYMIVDAGGNGSVTDTGGAGTYSNGEAALATDGVQALLVWTSGGDVFGRRILYDGSKLDTDAGFLISGANSQQFAPGVGWNGSVFEVAWTDFRAHVNVLETGIGDVYAARVDANGVVLDPNGTVVANDFLTPEGRASVAGGASASVVAFEALRTSAPFGNWRVAVTAKLPSTGTAFCSGDGSGTACPCGNVGDAGSGCGNSVNASGARLSGAGMASVSNDQFVLSGTGMPNSSALYFQGTTQSGGGLGVVFGDGLRCAGGSITRLGAKLNAGGVSQFPSGADPAISVKAMNTAGDVRTYQVWYRNAAPFCSASTFNLTNGLQVTWSP